MKKFILLTFLFTLTILVAGQSARRQPNYITAETNVMSFNIRYDNPGDGINTWKNRKEKVIQTVLDYQVDIVGFQEVLHNQLMDLEEGLPGYDWMGVGRDDGIEMGEYSPIFYYTGKFSEVGSGYFWLSESPMEAGSKGWDAAFPRIATWAKLKDNRTGRVIFVLNTHFDHLGQVARRESAKLILQKIDAYTRKEQFSVIVTGDFNAVPESDVIKTMTDVGNSLHLTDSRKVASKKSGVNWSFHDFGRLETDKRPLLDYVFVKNNVSVLEYEVIDDTGGIDYASDHCAVWVKVQF